MEKSDSLIRKVKKYQKNSLIGERTIILVDDPEGTIIGYFSTQNLSYLEPKKNEDHWCAGLVEHPELPFPHPDVSIPKAYSVALGVRAAPDYKWVPGQMPSILTRKIAEIIAELYSDHSDWIFIRIVLDHKNAVTPGKITLN